MTIEAKPSHEETTAALYCCYRALRAILTEPEARKDAMKAVNWQYIERASEDAQAVLIALNPNFNPRD